MQNSRQAANLKKSNKTNRIQVWRRCYHGDKRSLRFETDPSVHRGTAQSSPPNPLSRAPPIASLRVGRGSHGYQWESVLVASLRAPLSQMKPVVAVVVLASTRLFVSDCFVSTTRTVFVLPAAWCAAACRQLAAHGVTAGCTPFIVVC